ncbi:ABC transporter substrate-binding protein [Kitasatospora sp. NPDC051914]|uniref:ABC transporter substrate-binding protein n=1 Tax=Kitasatospora sp. NPDC051914 TaxID=3154945 RepID=UPI003418F3E1
MAGGCSLPDGDAQRGDESGIGPVTLVTGRDRAGYLQGLLDSWNTGHPGERATLVELPDAADEVRAQLAEGLARGSDRFDVVNLDVVWTAEFAEKGWIAPLDPAQTPTGSLLPAAVGTGHWNGKLYAVPFTTNVGLLYYRSDVLAAEGAQPPRTWAELERLAREAAPRHGLDGYAGQLLPYEGLTVNVAEAVGSAGGRLLDDRGAVAVDGPQARAGLEFLSRGVREGWIPRAALGYREEESRQAFQDGRLLFLRCWPYAYPLAEGPGSAVAGRFGVVPLPGPDGPGTSVLGGSDLAVNAGSRHQRTARELIRFLTGRDVQRRVLTEGGLPPVWADLYTDPELVRRYPYLPAVRQALDGAVQRPASPEYQQLSLAVSAAAYDALLGRSSADEAVARMAADLKAITG